jgi:peptide/nickel transport system substrate-binding protein
VKRSGLKRWIAVLAAAVLLAALCACGTGAGTETSETLPVLPTQTASVTAKDILTLPFANRDVLNPYAAETELNLNLGALLYEGLFAIDETYKAQPVLAADITQESNLSWRVTLRTDRVFHNGNAVTAADVVYSYEKASRSAVYAPRLANVARLREKDGMIEVNLRRVNQYIAANLDFPIVPVGSAEQERLATAKNGYLFTKASTPLGTGYYKLAAHDGSFALEYDIRHPGQAPALKTIVLYGVNNSAALLYGLEMNNFDFAYDNLNDGKVVRVSASVYKVPTTNLVYLGFHASKGGLQDAALRAALGACVNKADVLTDAYHGYAQVTDIPFPGTWFGVRSEDFRLSYNAANARKALESLGYNQLKNGVRASRYRRLSFTLLVNKSSTAKFAAARAIQKQLESFQMEITLKALPAVEYAAAVKAGAFDLYVGELKLTPDCGLSPLLISGGAATKGIQVWGKASSAYGQLLQGLLSPAEFVRTFQDELPFLPLGYRFGAAASVRSLRIPGLVLQEHLYAGISAWEFHADK